MEAKGFHLFLVVRLAVHISNGCFIGNIFVKLSQIFRKTQETLKIFVNNSQKRKNETVKNK